MVPRAHWQIVPIPAPLSWPLIESLGQDLIGHMLSLREVLDHLIGRASLDMPLDFRLRRLVGCHLEAKIPPSVQRPLPLGHPT